VVLHRSEVIVHSAGERETVPLSIHHLPFALTFAFFGVRPATLCHANHWKLHTHECVGVFTPGRSSRTSLGLPIAAGRSCGWAPDGMKPNRGHELKIPLAWRLQDGDLVVLDPGSKEEAAQSGRLTVVVNAHKEVCAVQKLDGVPLSPSMVSTSPSAAHLLHHSRCACSCQSCM
jgi:3' exoribonuclease family, domain 2